MNHQLDLMYGSFLEQKHTPIKINLEDNVTVENYSTDTFVLKDSIGSIRRVKNEILADNDFLIVRVNVSYTKALEITKDYSSGIFFMSLLKNEMLTVASTYFDLDSCEKITFKKPGTEGSFFRELDNFAAYELRLYVEKTTKEKNEQP